MKRYYIGIDNGISGALSMLSDGRIINAVAMPIQATRKGNEVDAIRVWQTLKTWTHGIQDDVTVIFEEPSGSRSAIAATSMAGAFHCIRALIEVMQLRLVRVTPQAWQKPFLKCKPKQTKEVALQKVKSLFPAFDLRENPKCHVPHMGIVDAICIAEWGRINNI